MNTRPGHLDPIDAAIVQALERDARASYALIGQGVALSAPAVKRRVDRLRAAGVIVGFTVRLDPRMLGWECEAYVELFCVGAVTAERLRAAVEALPEVVAADTVTGDADAMLRVRTRDTRHLEQVVERLSSMPFVARTRTTIALSPLIRRTEVPD